MIYDFSDAWLRYGTVCKLADAQERLLELGYSLCIWDAFRPAEAQDRLWAVYPDGNYVANPANGYSGHTRGDTVDVTLVTEAGEAVELPSGFDDFSARAEICPARLNHKNSSRDGFVHRGCCLYAGTYAAP